MREYVRMSGLILAVERMFFSSTGLPRLLRIMGHETCCCCCYNMAQYSTGGVMVRASDGVPSSPLKGAQPPPPLFGACLLWPNG